MTVPRHYPEAVRARGVALASSRNVGILAGGVTLYVVCVVDVWIQRYPSPESNRHRGHHDPVMAWCHRLRVNLFTFHHQRLCLKPYFC